MLVTEWYHGNYCNFTSCYGKLLVSYCYGATVVLCFTLLILFNYFCFSGLSFTGVHALTAIANTAIVVVTLYLAAIVCVGLSVTDNHTATLLFVLVKANNCCCILLLPISVSSWQLFGRVKLLQNHFILIETIIANLDRNVFLIILFLLSIGICYDRPNKFTNGSFESV